jgi:DNA-binding HxlR family transcriptional regulator
VAKSYCQYCPVAHALDLVGERWALLIVRELLYGSQRYTDLAAHLPGIGTNILAARLRDLEAAGVVTKRKLPPPTPVTIYELTETGRTLQRVVAELALWGARSLGPPDTTRLEPGWIQHPLRLFTEPGFRGRIQFRIGDELATVVDDLVLEGSAGEPDTLVEGDPEGFYHLLLDGRAEGVTVTGDEALLSRWLERVAPQPEAAPA